MKKSFNIKSQASMEFIILFGIVLIIFVVFMALTADRLKEATDDRDIIAMKTLGDSIRNGQHRNR